MHMKKIPDWQTVAVASSRVIYHNTQIWRQADYAVSHRNMGTPNTNITNSMLPTWRNKNPTNMVQTVYQPYDIKGLNHRCV